MNPETTPTKQTLRRGSAPALFGRNIRPGMTPGGFSSPMQDGSTPITRRKIPIVGDDHKEIKEACDALLEGREPMKLGFYGQA